MNNRTLSFTVTADPTQFLYRKDDRPALEGYFSDGTVKIFAYYTANEAPLQLQAKADTGDTVMLAIRPYRLELYVNGSIMDEEWPFGDALFADAVLTECHTELNFGEPSPKEQKDSFCGSFTDAEGWYPGNGIFVGDCMPYTDNGRYHVLYLKDRHHHSSKWYKGAHQWEHISTTDLVHWDIHPMAVAIDDPIEGSICTGSWICLNGIHQLYYTVRMADGTSAPIKRSVSTDGYHYQKDGNFSFTLSDAYTGESARDPKVVLDSDGILHMFVTTTLRKANKGCLVHLTSKDGETWEEQGTIYTAADASEPECSDYFCYRGRYYLIFSLGGRAHYLYSDKPFSDWKIPKEQIIPCRNVPKAAIWNDRIIFTGYENHLPGRYAGSMTFMEAAANETGEMYYFPVKEMQK